MDLDSRPWKFKHWYRLGYKIWMDLFTDHLLRTWSIPITASVRRLNDLVLTRWFVGRVRLVHVLFSSVWYLNFLHKSPLSYLWHSRAVFKVHVRYSTMEYFLHQDEYCWGFAAQFTESLRSHNFWLQPPNQRSISFQRHMQCLLSAGARYRHGVVHSEILCCPPSLATYWRSSGLVLRKLGKLI